MLCLWLLFALKTRKKTDPDHKETCLKGFPIRLYSNSSMLSYIKKLEFLTPCRVYVFKLELS